MLGASLLPARFRLGYSSSATSPPSWLNRWVSPVLQSWTRRSCNHPIHTIVFVLLLASTSYVGFLEGGLSDSKSASGSVGSIDFNSLVDGSRQLKLSQGTGWRWQQDSRTPQELDVVGESLNSAFRSSQNQAEDHLALVTLVFPNSLSHTSPQIAPSADSIPFPRNTTVKSLPSTSNPFSPISQDSSLAYSVPWKRVTTFLDGIREIPEQTRLGTDSDRVWITKAPRRGGGQRSLREWASNAWTEFLDLLKNAETLDITIMFLGYLSMHLTFVSLFMSMRKMGSNFWLATTTLFSSMFAFSFGLAVTTKLGVPINMVLLSEGLPFLVVTVGFEKPIVLTKAVLAASLNSRRQEVQADDDDSEIKVKDPKTVHYAVETAIKERGFEIVRDYAIEIVILIAGAASGIQGGLRQFCFLAAWIMVFDCILLFTFYTAILCVKLEINRIKRHVTLRRALEEDGVSRRVAENVASSNDWPKLENSEGTKGGVGVFGRSVGDSSVPRFKVLLFGGFILVTAINIMTIPFRAGNKNAVSPTVSGIQGVLNSPTIDPFKVAENGLDFLHSAAEKEERSIIVTVLPPVKYELRVPQIMEDPDTFFEGDYDHIFEAMGGRVVGGGLNCLNDPLLS